MDAGGVGGNSLPRLVPSASPYDAVEGLIELAVELDPANAGIINRLADLPSHPRVTTIMNVEFPVVVEAVRSRDRGAALAALLALDRQLRGEVATSPINPPPPSGKRSKRDPALASNDENHNTESVGPELQQQQRQQQQQQQLTATATAAATRGPTLMRSREHGVGRPKQAHRTELQRAGDHPMEKRYDVLSTMIEVCGGACGLGPLLSGPWSNRYRQHALVSSVRPLLAAGPRTVAQLVAARAEAGAAAAAAAAAGEGGDLAGVVPPTPSKKEQADDEKKLAAALEALARGGASGVAELSDGRFERAPLPLTLGQVSRMLIGLKGLLVEDPDLADVDEPVGRALVDVDRGFDNPALGEFAVLRGMDAADVVMALRHVLRYPPGPAVPLARAIVAVLKRRRKRPRQQERAAAVGEEGGD